VTGIRHSADESAVEDPLDQLRPSVRAPGRFNLRCASMLPDHRASCRCLHSKFGHDGQLKMPASGPDRCALGLVSDPGSKP